MKKQGKARLMIVRRIGEWLLRLKVVYNEKFRQ
jgi:hypothetical protein